MEKIKSLDDFQNKLTSAQYVIMDFSSPGCAPCKKVPALLEEIIEDESDKNIAAYEVDITENMEVAQKVMVMGVPTIIVFKDGNEVKRFNSVPKKAKIVKVIK